ncbi:MAG: dTMP kinase [Pseudomonadota bacterium]
MFITLEGIEGSGKSTALKALVAHFEAQGRTVTVTREPGGSRLGTTLRAILLDLANTDITKEAELFLYLADRAQHVAQVIKPALEAGHIVISDRYADSTVVYQGYGRGLDPLLLQQLNDVAVAGLWPDRTLLFDLNPELGLNRALARNIREGIHTAEGRFEAESIAFHTRIREGYLTWAVLHAERYRIVDASATMEDVAAAAVAMVG